MTIEKKHHKLRSLSRWMINLFLSCMAISIITFCTVAFFVEDYFLYKLPIEPNEITIDTNAYEKQWIESEIEKFATLKNTTSELSREELSIEWDRQNPGVQLAYDQEIKKKNWVELYNFLSIDSSFAQQYKFEDFVLYYSCDVHRLEDLFISVQRRTNFNSPFESKNWELFKDNELKYYFRYSALVIPFEFKDSCWKALYNFITSSQEFETDLSYEEFVNSYANDEDKMQKLYSRIKLNSEKPSPFYSESWTEFRGNEFDNYYGLQLNVSNKEDRSFDYPLILPNGQSFNQNPFQNSQPYRLSNLKYCFGNYSGIVSNDIGELNYKIMANKNTMIDFLQLKVLAYKSSVLFRASYWSLSVILIVVTGSIILRIKKKYPSSKTI